MLSYTLRPPWKKINCNSLGKLKDVKDELFHFNSIWFVRFDEMTLHIHIWDLLLGHMVLQLWFVLPDTKKRQEKRSLLHIYNTKLRYCSIFGDKLIHLVVLCKLVPNQYEIFGIDAKIRE